MSEYEDRLGDEAATDPQGAEIVPGVSATAGPAAGQEPVDADVPDAVAHLRRSRRGVLGTGVPADRALFAGRIARAVADGSRPGTPGSPPALSTR